MFDLIYNLILKIRNSLTFKTVTAIVGYHNKIRKE